MTKIKSAHFYPLARGILASSSLTARRLFLGVPASIISTNSVKKSLFRSSEWGVKNWITVVKQYLNQGIGKKKPSNNQYHSNSIQSHQCIINLEARRLYYSGEDHSKIFLFFTLSNMLIQRFKLQSHLELLSQYWSPWSILVFHLLEIHTIILYSFWRT